MQTTCTICGDPIRATAWREGVSDLCPGCAPNLAASIDRRLTPEALHVPEDVLAEWQAELRAMRLERSGRAPGRR